MTIKAVIVAAGYGSRLFPVTRVVPKELLPLVNKPVLQFVLDELLEAGISDVLVITSPRGAKTNSIYALVGCTENENLNATTP